jgi:hypothetical protein
VLAGASSARARSAGGAANASSQKDFPTASAADQPNVVLAPGFQSWTVPRSSTEMIACGAACTTALIRASARRPRSSERRKYRNSRARSTLRRSSGPLTGVPT